MRRIRADLERAAARLVLAGTMALAGGQTGFAQSPFNPFSRQASSSFSAVRVPDSVNRPTAARDINQFDDLDGGLFDDFGGVGGSLRRGGVSTSPRSTLRSGLGVPYYRAHREFDEQYDRVYRPNREADAEFYARQEERSERYRAAMKEKDPSKRAELLRKMSREFSDIDRARTAAPKAAKPGETEKPASDAAPPPTSSASRALRDAMERSSRGGSSRRSPLGTLRRAMPGAGSSSATSTPKPDEAEPAASPRINLPTRRPRLPLESLDEPSAPRSPAPAASRTPGTP